jgi:predicted nucleic acid-binding Zn ribbon protein
MRNLRLVQWGDRIISEECYTELTTRPRKRRIDWGNVVAWALALILMAWVLWSTT